MKAKLKIDLDTVAENYRMLRQHCPEDCGATVKADAYGLGVRSVVKVLIDAGCKTYFVATLAEGIALRNQFRGIDIYVFSGLGHDDSKQYKEHNLHPVLNTIDQLICWGKSVPSKGAAFHIDTGMNRLGVSPEKLLSASEMQTLFRSARVKYLMTHLSCADTPAHTENVRQLQQFRQFADNFPYLKTSIGNSAGVLNGVNYCGSLARPGIALYGGNPWLNKANPTGNVIRLLAPILQTRSVEGGKPVGYGAAYCVRNDTVLATVGIGYADGIPRCISHQAYVLYNNRPCRIIGRVSMDTIIINISSAPKPSESKQHFVELVGRTSIDTFCKMVRYDKLRVIDEHWLAH